MNLVQALKSFYAHSLESITRGLGPRGTRIAGSARGNAMSNIFKFPQAYLMGYQQVQSLEAVRHYRGWVYVAVTAIAQKIGQFKPSVAYVRQTGNELKEKRFIGKSAREQLKSMTKLKEHEDLEPVEDDHPLVQLLDNPNDPDVSFSLWYKLIMYGELCGKTYIWIPHTNGGMPAEMWILPSHWVRPEPGQGDQLISGYWVQPMEGIYTRTWLPVEDVIEWVWPSPLSVYDGFAPTQGGSAWIDTSEAMDASRWHQMKNLHNAGLVLGLEKGITYPTPEDIDRAYTMLNNRLNGEGKNRMPLILPPGWTSLGRYGMSSEELDFVSSNDQIRDQVLALYRVPKGIVGIEPGQANTSAYAPSTYFFDQCINPKLYYLGQVLTEKLAARYGDDIRIYWENSTPHDPQLEHTKNNDAIDRATITINEYRERSGLKPVEWGDTPQMRPGYMPMMQGAMATEPLLKPREISELVLQAEQANGDAKEEPRQLPKRLRRKNMLPADSIKVEMPDVRQETIFSCGASACEAIARMYGVGPDEEEWYRDALDTDPEAGTPPENIRDLFDNLGLLSVAADQMTDDDLKVWLDKHVPVMLLIQAYGNPADYGKDENGHYVVAIGYTNEDLIVEDPSLRLTRGYIPWSELDGRWHDAGMNGEKFVRWGLAVLKHETARYVRRLLLPTTNGNGKH